MEALCLSGKGFSHGPAAAGGRPELPKISRNVKYGTEQSGGNRVYCITLRRLPKRHPRGDAALWSVLAGLLLPLSVSAAPPRFDISRFDVQGKTLLAPAELDTLLAPHRGADRDFGDVQRAVEALQAAYARHGFTLVRVALPEQELNGGVVRFQVVETRVGRVAIEGNRFHDDANIRHSLPGLAEGTLPNIARISASLAQANENPSKKTTLQLKDGARPDEVDARLAVVDEKAWSVALNVDNTGLEQTGKTLVGVVYQNANFAGLDHVLSLQYTTTAEQPKKVSVYGAGYHLPLYALDDSLDFYTNYSHFHSGTLPSRTLDMQVHGNETVYGARYNHSFGNLGPVESSASLGFDYKAFRNGVTFQGFPVGNDVTVHPLSLAYAGTWKAGASVTALTLSLARNLPGGDRGGTDDFERVRSGARPGYTLARLGAAYTRSLGLDWQLRLAAAGQYSRDALVPGEQFGAGGVGSVRGFLTREISGDKGYSASAELYTPELCARWQGAAVSCRALVFYDAAHVSRIDPLPGELSSVSIGSPGPGVPAALGRHATLQLDLGHVVDGAPVEARGRNRLNFKLSLAD